MDIRNILDIIAENTTEVKENSQLLGEMQVMSLDTFLEKSGVEPPEEQVDEVAPLIATGVKAAASGAGAAVANRVMDKMGLEEESQSLEKMGDWIRKFQENEDNNFHSENVIHMAELVGTPEDVKKAKELLRKHHAKGFMDEELLDQRKELQDRLWPKVAKMFELWKKSGISDEKEIDEEKLGGTFASPLSDKDAAEYFDRILDKKKEKRDKYKMPYVHRSNVIPIVSDDGRKYDMQKLMAAISDRPKKILKQNEKMQHSDGSTSEFFNVGLPALRGLAVDEDKGEFVVINTCPGAGECKVYCYALKGGYVQWKAVSMSQSRLLNWLYNDPDGFMAQLDSEISSLAKRAGKKNSKIVIRWHDAGDFFSPQYLEKAYALASRHPDVDFYAYTKIASVAQAERPDNFKINFSMGALGSEEKQINFTRTKNSRVVPTAMFNDLIAKEGNKLIKDDKGRMQFKSKEDLDTFKKRLAAKYSVDVDTILTYDEMMNTPVSDEKNKYNVIVMPGDGDDSANRLDVLNTFLLFH